MLLLFCSSRRGHTRCALVTGVQTCALPILQVILLKRASGIGFGRTWAAIWEPLAASAVMGIALHYGLPAAERLTANPWLRLTAAVSAGTAIYGLALIAISPLWRALFFKKLGRASWRERVWSFV